MLKCKVRKFISKQKTHCDYRAYNADVKDFKPGVKLGVSQMKWNFHT